MFKYVQIDDENIVIGISQLSGEVISDNMILINDIEVELGSTYDSSTQTFTPPEVSPGLEQQPTLEEMQAQTLLNTELLLIYKEIETGV